MVKLLARLGIVLMLGGCATNALPGEAPACAASAPPGTVYLISHGWHTDLVLPASGLEGGLAVFRRIFPGMRQLVVGFGRRTFLIAPVKTFGDLLVGPLPGRGAMQILALSAPPPVAYADGLVATLEPTGAQRDRLDEAIWRSFHLDRHGDPVEIGPGLIAGSLFYASTRGYSGLYTCNTWTTDMLAKAGLPISPALDIFAGQTMRRAAPLVAGGLCRIEH